MATYAIGDIQGCFDPLRRLLDKINFDPGQDKLWFAGDLVNRGPESLKTLRYVKSLGKSAVTVLGNHDIHLLALHYGLRPRDKDPTLAHVLDASDVAELILWLQQQPFLHSADDFILVHAGLHPDWTIETAKTLAAELHAVIKNLDNTDTLSELYGPSDGTWSDAASTRNRLRYALNCFTRLRFCDKNAVPDFKYSCVPGEQPAHLRPWFTVPNRPTGNLNIIFGHWAALGVFNKGGIHALDSGCVWGKSLTALRLSDQKIFDVKCP